MVTGKMTKLTDMAATATLTEPGTKVTGRKTNNTDRVLRPGQTVPATKETTFTAKNTAKDASHGLMEAPTQVNSWRTISKEWELSLIHI